jgi:hypothetical protein
MRIFGLIFILLAFVNCKGQDISKEYHFPQVGWTVRMPATSKLLSAAQFDTILSKAVAAINQTYDADFSFDGMTPLFTIREGQYNIIGSTINVFDTTSGMTPEESYAYSKQMMMEVINEKAPAVRIIDTLSSFEIIDGLRFEKLTLKTFYPALNLTMITVWLYRKQNIYDFSINISYTDEKIGVEFLNLIKASKFNKIK